MKLTCSLCPEEHEEKQRLGLAQHVYIVAGLPQLEESVPSWPTIDSIVYKNIEPQLQPNIQLQYVWFVML